MSQSDRIERQVVLRAPRAKVWRAIADSGQFGQWFGMALEGPFVPGLTARGHITSKGHEHLKVALEVVSVEPERLLSFRWHPYAIDPSVDYSSEPTTLVEFTLADVPDGVRVTVVESGFDQIPQGRRHEAFRMNGEGWTIQARNLEAHVARP